MAMENYCSDSGVSKKRAKELLTSEEVEWLKIVVKSFSKTKSMETFCSNLFKILNSSSSTVDHDILAKVRQCLPKNQRSKFTRYCNELFKTETLRVQRRGLARNGIIGEANEFKRDIGLENFAPNFQASPAKRKKQDKLRPLKTKIEKKESKIDRASADCAKDGKQSKNKTSKAQRKTLDSPSRSGNKIIVLERNSLKQGFGFRILGGSSREPSITVAEVKQGSIADQQGLNYRDKIVSVNEKRCGKNGMNMNELIRKIKASKVLHVRITPVQRLYENVRRAEDVGEANGRERRKQEDELSSVVTVYPGEDGWLGCCIRGYVHQLIKYHHTLPSYPLEIGWFSDFLVAELCIATTLSIGDFPPLPISI